MLHWRKAEVCNWEGEGIQADDCCEQRLGLKQTQDGVGTWLPEAEVTGRQVRSLVVVLRVFRGLTLTSGFSKSIVVIIRRWNPQAIKSTCSFCPAMDALLD